jgi:hypothetical protein
MEVPILGSFKRTEKSQHFIHMISFNNIDVIALPDHPISINLFTNQGTNDGITACSPSSTRRLSTSLPEETCAIALQGTGISTRTGSSSGPVINFNKNQQSEHLGLCQTRFCLDYMRNGKIENRP